LDQKGLDFVYICFYKKAKMFIFSGPLWQNQKGRWVAKLVSHLLATAALWVRIQTSPKITKWQTYAKEWPTHSSPPQKNIVWQAGMLRRQILAASPLIIYALTTTYSFGLPLLYNT
jgi:hypothetical protein